MSSLSRGLEDWALVEAHRRLTLGPAGRPDLYVPRWQRMLVFVLVAGMAGSLVVVGLALRRPPGDPLAVGNPPAVAPLTLEELAAVARTQPRAPHDMSHPYIHLVVDHIPSEAQRAAGLVGWREEQWIARDGAGRIRAGALPGADEAGQEFDEGRGPGGLTVAGFVPSELDRLPRDPTTLLAALRAALGETVLPEHVISLLGLPTLAPDVRGGLVEALGQLGVTVVDDASPDDGGTRFSAPRGDGTVEVTFGRRTARPTTLHVRADEPSTKDPAKTVFRVSEVGTG